MVRFLEDWRKKQSGAGACCDGYGASGCGGENMDTNMTFNENYKHFIPAIRLTSLYRNTI